MATMTINVEALGKMLKMQEELQNKVGDLRFESHDLKERAAFIRDHYVYLDQEVQEMLYEIPYFKNWKDYSKMTDEEIQKAYATAKEELVDAWHFFMNLMLGLGMTADELFKGYMDKHAENVRRQEEGYDHTMKHIGITKGEENMSGIEDKFDKDVVACSVSMDGKTETTDDFVAVLARDNGDTGIYYNTDAITLGLAVKLIAKAFVDSYNSLPDNEKDIVVATLGEGFTAEALEAVN